MSDDYRQLKNADDSVAAFRRQNAIDTVRAQLLAETDMAALNGLRNRAPGNPYEVGIESSNAQRMVSDLKTRVPTALELAGMTEDDLPWETFVPEFEGRLGQEEELHARMKDQYENPEAYGLDAAGAKFAFYRADERVKAFQALVDRAKSNVKSDDAPKKGRRSAPVDDGDTAAGS